MQILLAVLLASTLAGPLAAGTAAPEDFNVPPECTSHWLRNPEPYELGDLSAVSPWTVYIIADGYDPTMLTYGSWGWGNQLPLYLGPALLISHGGTPRIELDSAQYPGGIVYWVWAYEPGGDCALWSVYVPRDHGHGQ